MKNYFVHLEDIFSLLEDAPQLDDAHLGYMVGLIDRIDFYVDGKPDKECLADLLNYVLFLFSTR